MIIPSWWEKNLWKEWVERKELGTHSARECMPGEARVASVVVVVVGLRRHGDHMHGRATGRKRK